MTYLPIIITSVIQIPENNRKKVRFFKLNIKSPTKPERLPHPPQNWHQNAAPSQQYYYRLLIMATVAMKAFPPEHEASKRKLQLCKGFAESGFCVYGQNCFFAHGADELHQPTLKTKMCRNFHQHRYCKFGSRCNFVHDPHHGPAPKKQKSMLKMMEEYPDFLTELSFRRKLINFYEKA